MAHWTERAIVLSRWAMVPFYLGLVVALLLLFDAFLRELLAGLAGLGSASQHLAMVRALALVDLTLMAGLVVIVLFSGYGNMVARLENRGPATWPASLSSVDFDGLKKKLFGTMAAISGVALLKGLMEFGATVDERQLLWLVVTNAVFLLGYLLMAVSDWYGSRTKALDKDAAG